MTSGTSGWNTSPNTMPTTSAAIPITGTPSASARSWTDLRGEHDVTGGAGGHGQAVTGADRRPHSVGGLQQPQPDQCRAAVEAVAQGVLRPQRDDLVRTGDGVIVDQ